MSHLVFSQEKDRLAPSCLPMIHMIEPSWVGVEVGVGSGVSSELFCQRARFMFLVDAWTNYDGYDEQHERFGSYQQTRKRLREYYNFMIVHETSYKAACVLTYFNDTYEKQLDFAFIDANHAYNYVKSDICFWAPMIRPGGWLFGHDYNLQVEFAGVQRAVDEYAKVYGLKVEVFEAQAPQLHCWGIHLV